MKAAIIIATLVFLMISVFIILILIAYSRRQKKNRREKEQMQIQFSQTLLQSQLEIQEQTMQHISRELHDNLGHIASLIKINLNTIDFSDINKASTKAEDTRELTRQLIRDLKGLSVSMGSEHLSRTGFLKALEIEVQRLNKTGEFNAKLITELDQLDISEERIIILYRMVQEILNNCIKHSEAKHIEIVVQKREDTYILAISDDGKGFIIDDAGTSTSAGLTNLKSRAKLIDAQLDIQSTLHSGTGITLLLNA
jgi:signal transduction histidine kinase